MAEFSTPSLEGSLNRAIIGPYSVVSGQAFHEGDAEYTRAMNGFSAIARGYLSTSMLTVFPTSRWREAISYGYSYGNLPDSEIPPPRHYVVEGRVGTKHENFAQRSADGEILLSNYDRFAITVRQQPGQRLIGFYPDGRYSLSVRALVEAGLGSYSNNVFRLNGSDFYWISYSIDNPSISYVRVGYTGAEWVFHPILRPERILAELKGIELDPTSVVTKTMSYANRRSVDLLTALAELPKSIKSLYSALGHVARFARDAKRGVFLTKTKFDSKSTSANERYHNDIRRLQKGLSDPSLGSKRRRALLEEQKRITISHSTNLKRFADELASETANIWLNYRYNIMPNVYLAQDILSAVQKYESTFITSRSKEVFQEKTLSILGWNPVMVESQLSCMIKRSFTSLQALNGASVVSNDLFVTAWELVPLSFVYDWFLNIGDLLSAFNYKKSWDQEGSTLAKKISIEYQEILPNNHQYSEFAIDPTTSVEGYWYNREVIDPFNLCGIVFKPSLGLERQLDALALLWRPVRSNLKRNRI